MIVDDKKNNILKLKSNNVVMHLTYTYHYVHTHNELHICYYITVYILIDGYCSDLRVYTHREIYLSICKFKFIFE